MEIRDLNPVGDGYKFFTENMLRVYKSPISYQWLQRLARSSYFNYQFDPLLIYPDIKAGEQATYDTTRNYENKGLLIFGFEDISTMPVYWDFGFVTATDEVEFEITTPRFFLSFLVMTTGEQKFYAAEIEVGDDPPTIKAEVEGGFTIYNNLSTDWREEGTEQPCFFMIQMEEANVAEVG